VPDRGARSRIRFEPSGRGTARDRRVRAAGTFEAGSIGDVSGTGSEDVSRPIGYAGGGTARDYHRLHLDPTGKIVFAWWNPDDVWPNHMAYRRRRAAPRRS
jgi:hypothetical protein